MISAILLVIALILFLARSVPVTSRLNLISLGLASLTLAFLLRGIPNLPWEFVILEFFSWTSRVEIF